MSDSQSATRNSPFATRFLLIVACVLLLIPALQPLFTADLTCGYDNTFHLWRAVEVENLLQQGILFSRWAPHMAHGYGYPLFNFSAPLSAYGTALFHLVGFSWPWAINMTFALGWILSALAMFVFVGDLFGRPAGLVAAVLYAYVPFHAYDVFYRGGLSQSSAWFFPPLILWALRRADRRVGFVMGALCFAGLILTHNAFALLFAPLFLIYLLVIGCEKGKGVALRGVLALLVGLGLSAFFWLPALADLSFVHSERVSGAWVFDYANNFLPLDQLFALPRTADSNLINDWPARGLGLVPALLALMGLLTLRDRQQRLRIVFFAGSLALCLFLILPISQPLWDALPLLQRVQFPWRLLGPAALCAAVLAGAAVSYPVSLTARSSQTATSNLESAIFNVQSAIFISLLILLHLGWFYPRHCAPPQEISARGMIAWERQTDTVGTTALGEFLPVWVEQMPQSTYLEEQIAAGTEVARFDETALPEGAAVLEADYAALRATVRIETPTSFRARYLAFDFPGWQVRVDGEPVDITPTDPEGLISFDVPAGRHTVTVRFGETSLRLVADTISLVSLLAFVIIAIRVSVPQVSLSHCLPIPPSSYFSLLLTAALLVTVKLAVIDRLDTPLRRSNLAGDQLRRVDVPAQVAFDGQFRLLGYDALPQQVPGDQPVNVRLYWQDPVPGGPNYRVTLALRDGQGRVWNDPDLRPPRWHRVAPAAYLWPPHAYALTAFEIQPLPGVPPGTYTITLGVFDRGTLAPYAAQDGAGQLLGLEIPLGQVVVDRPRQAFVVENASPQHQADVPYGPLRLVGYNLDRVEAAPGDPFALTLFWQADQLPEEDLMLRLHLQSPAGEAVVVLDLPLVRDDFPTSQWQAGDLWRGQRLFRLPAGLESGEHRWSLQVCRTEAASCQPLGEPVGLGNLYVTAPDRLWQAPPLDVETDTSLGDVVTLLGAVLRHPTSNIQPGTPFTVTLVWQAVAEMDTSYRVFLHLLGPDGAAIAQSDGEPAGWTRPTTGWLPGEVVLDERVLSIPEAALPGEYVLQAGMYTLEHGRLTTFEGIGAVQLVTIQVEAR